MMCKALLAISALCLVLHAENPPGKDGNSMDGKIFVCNGAGRWFPADPGELRAMVDGFLDKAKSVSANPLAVISPHAGFIYSGSGAGESYKALEGKDIRRVIILGPSHSRDFRGISVLKGYTHYETPLGRVKIDEAGTAALLKEKHFLFDLAAHRPEHSVENQIPFIQRALPKAEIIACVAGFMDAAEMAEAGGSMAKLLDGKTVLAVSSDFTHYGRSFDFMPFTSDIRNNLEKLDGGAVSDIAKDDAAAFNGYIEKTGATICGRNAISVMLFALAGKAKGRLLKYYTSSDDSGDFSHTVCYASIVMERK
jgi:MEMO1 family protein